MTNGRGESDSSVVPEKPPNKAEGPAAEAVEGRGLAKGNLPEQNASRTLSRQGASSALERVRQAAQKDRRQRFTALLHHVYDRDRLRRAYFALKRDAAAGIDGETWQNYGRVWKRISRTSPDGWRGERTGRGRSEEHSSRRRTGGDGRSEFPCWKIRSSSAPSSRL